MKQADKQLIITNLLLFVGGCILSISSILSAQSPITLKIAIFSGPILLLVSISVSFWAIRRNLQSRKLELKVLKNAIEGTPRQETGGLSNDITELLSLLKEERSRIHRILADHGETAALVSINLERVIRLTGKMSEFIEDVDKLSSRIHHLYQRFENSLLQAENQDDLSETILKIRFELDNFHEAPSSMLNLLKKVYSGFQQNRESLMAAHEAFLGAQSVMEEGEIGIFMKQQEAAEQIRNAVQALEKTLGEEETALVEGAELLQDITARFHSFSNELGEIQNLARELPEQIHRLAALAAELEDIHEKGKILALNAAIYAGDAGEEGKGFSTIAREMKTITESAELLQNHLQQGLDQLEKTAVHTLNGMEQMVTAEHSIVTFAETGQENYKRRLSGEDAVRKNRETLSTALHRMNELLEMQEKTARERQNNINRSLTELRNARHESENDHALKFQIDNMVIESARFSEKIENELPNLLNAVGGILDEVSAFQDQFLQTRNALADFTDPRIVKTLKELKQAVRGNEVQLLRASTNLLRKMKTYIPSN
ncbi:MAG: hypothetical protein GXO69_09920 [Acidobacteria bacterium]|nr:hypothetical protein [Acidobacteriota bacterium]